MSLITNGNLLFCDATQDDILDLHEYSTDGTLVQTFDIHTPYTPSRSQQSVMAVLSNGELLIAGTDSIGGGQAVFKVSQAGVASDFILHSSLSELGGGTYQSSMQKLSVDSQDRMYVSVLTTGFDGFLVKRFLSDGTFDQTFTFSISSFTPSGTYNFRIVERFFDISPDGRYIYSVMFWGTSGDPPNGQTYYADYSICKFDTENSMSFTIINEDYQFSKTTYNISGHVLRSGWVSMTDISTDKITGDLWISANYTTGDTGDTSHEADIRIHKISSTSGFLLNEYIISDSLPNWIDETTTSNTNAGRAFVLTMDSSNNLWGQVTNEARITGSNNVQIFKLNPTNGEVSVLNDWIITFPFITNAIITPMIFHSGGVYPALAYYDDEGTEIYFLTSF